MHLLLFLGSSLLLLLSSCAKEDPAPLRYLALGDSYTIGEGVPPDDRYPEKLATALRAAGYELDPPQVIAKTGWTTTELQQGITQAAPTGPFDLVSLLIGVNNQYRGQAIGLFESEFSQLLDQAIAFAGNRSERVFVFSIPDYAYTPFGQQRPNPDGISTDLDNYNALKQQIAESKGVIFFNITPISREGLEKPELVAADMLHPSGLQYQRWIDQYLDQIQALLP